MNKVLLCALSCILLLAGCANVSHVRDDSIVILDKRLSDEDFYNLVSCGAGPGQDCRHKRAKWAKRSLTVYIHPPQEGYYSRFEKDFYTSYSIHPKSQSEEGLPESIIPLRRAVQQAIEDINSIGVITLTLVDEPKGNIEIHAVAAEARQRIRGTRCPRLDGRKMGWAAFQYYDINSQIYRACIAFSPSITLGALQSVATEELAQILGLPWDITSKYYRGRSIFSQNGNNVKKLGQQDREAIRRHYE